MSTYNRVAFGLALLMILLGFAIVVRTVASGGGSVGYVVGPLFIALGAGRIHLIRRTRRGT